MHTKIFIHSLFCALVFSTPLYAGSVTLTTYYPSPSGNYNKLAANSMRLGSITLGEIKDQYQCTYESNTSLPRCPAGLLFYDKMSQTLYIADGTHWRYVNSTCIPLHQACSKVFNCSSDDCGNDCGTCIGPAACSSSTPGTPGVCKG